MSPDSNIHVFYSCAFQPATTLFQCFDTPNTRCAIEAKKVDEHTIHLLLHLKVEW